MMNLYINDYITRTFSHPLRIYRNLHKNGFSVQKYVRNKRGYRVKTVHPILLISSVSSKVYETGRQKVLREKSKNVHAYIICDNVRILGGEIISEDVDGLTEIFYNPYKNKGFIYADTKEQFVNEDWVLMYGGRAFVVNNTWLEKFILKKN